MKRTISIITSVILFVLNSKAQTPYQVKDIYAGTDDGFTSYFYPFNYNGVLLFEAETFMEGGELWRTDGTTAGTYMIKDIYTGFNGSSPSNFFEFNGMVYFSAYGVGAGRELWRTDGTNSGTYMVKDINTGTDDGIIFLKNVWEHNGYFFFEAISTGSNGEDLWKSDGTATGTSVVKDINPGPSGSETAGFTEFNNQLYFTAKDGSHGAELWKTDGTTAGTTLVKDINPGYLEGLPYFQIFWQQNGYFYFEATDSITAENELWKSDGTNAGTTKLKDINPGPYGSNPGYFFEYNNDHYFRADDGTHGKELWKTDGTTAGTMLVKDINVGTGDGYVSSSKIWEQNGYFFFLGESSTNNTEIWKTDGTTAGTTILKDINPGAAGSNFGGLITFNNDIFIAANNGANGKEIWKTDGTTAGTNLFLDIYPGAPDGLGGFFKAWEHNGYFFFYAKSAGVNDYELWKSDGTSAGTSQVKDINPGSGNSNPSPMREFNNELIFKADNGATGVELWKTDGTAAGTVLIKDIFSGIDPSNPYTFTTYNGYFYFTAEAGATGNREIWKSDGTTAGTTLVLDINPGNPGSYPEYFTMLNNTYLLFLATNATTGKELWSFNMPGIGANTNEETHGINLCVYPNPTKDYVTIKSSEEKLTINLFDIRGKLIRQFITTDSLTNLDVRGLVPGMYFLGISDGKSVLNRKIILE